MRVRFESIYTETDRHGNTRRWENRLEAEGERYEISGLLADLKRHSSLPGLTPLFLDKKYQKYLT